MQSKKSFYHARACIYFGDFRHFGCCCDSKNFCKRDDAKLVALKSDINTLKTSFPAYFLAQGEGTFISAVTLSSANWNLNDYTITSKLQDKNGNPCVSATLLDSNHSTANTPKSVQFLQLSTQASGNSQGDTCEKLIESIHLVRELKIPLLSSSIVF